MKRLEHLQGLRFLLFLAVFMFHTSMFQGMKDTILYQYFFGAGGMLGVCCFFVLSGFVVGIQEPAKQKSIGMVVWKRIRKIYPYHLFFLLAVLPLFIFMFISDFGGSLIKLILNALLLQSWIPTPDYYLSYNGVSWFLSTLIFLSVFDIPLYWVFSKISRNIPVNAGCIAVIIFCCTVSFVLAFFVKENSRYWLYIFPPTRLLDYISGFCAGKLFLYYKDRRKMEQKHLQNDKRKTWAGSMILFIMVIFMICGNLVPFEYSRQAIFMPGAILTVMVIGGGYHFLQILNWCV